MKNSKSEMVRIAVTDFYHNVVDNNEIGSWLKEDLDLMLEIVEECGGKLENKHYNKECLGLESITKSIEERAEETLSFIDSYMDDVHYIKVRKHVKDKLIVAFKAAIDQALQENRK